jgi:hypothetical protein
MRTHNIFKKAVVVAIIATVFWACRPEAIKPYDGSAVQNGSVSSIAGVWSGSSVTQRDNGAENKNFPYKTEDITTVLQATKWKLTLNATGNTPTSFAIDHGTGVPYFMNTTGSWKVDDVNKVGKVYLINGTDTTMFTLGSYQNLLNNKLFFKQEKLLLGKPAITYEFTFSKN